MLCGFAILEVGSVRSKNATSILCKVFVGACINGIAFYFLGYGFLTSTGNGFIGGGMWLFEGAYLVDVFYQYVFMVASTAIVSGVMAERGKLISFLIFSAIYSSVVYPLIAHWAWATNGWLLVMGFLDVAGSSVVHIAGGASSLVVLFLMTARIGRFKEKDDPSLQPKPFFETFINAPHVNPMPGHSTPLVGLGTFILWMGFFPFNSSAVAIVEHYQFNFKISELIAKVIVNVMISTSAGGLTALALTRFLEKRWSINNLMMGVLSAAVAICAGCLHMSAGFSLLTGIIAALVYYLLVKILLLFRLDDPVEAVPVHLGGGITGTICVGLFANFDGQIGGSLVGIQLVGIAAITGFAFITSFILFAILKKLNSLQVQASVELSGLDQFMCGESAYPETYAQGDFLKFKAFLENSKTTTDFKLAKERFEAEREKKGLDQAVKMEKVEVKIGRLSTGSNMSSNNWK
jgi:Amt family ammonium transporter